MTSLEYYIEEIEQFISALTDDIESGEGTVVTQTKLAVYQEVLEHLEEIELEPSYNSIKTELNGDMISRQAVLDKKELVELEDGQSFYCISPEDVETLPPVTPQSKIGHWIEHPEIETSTPEYLMFYECSECGDRQCFCKSDIHKKRFCSNCGCRMVEPQERSCEG